MPAELSKSENCLSAKRKSIDQPDSACEELTPPPVPPLPVNYQRSDGKRTILFITFEKLANLEEDWLLILTIFIFFFFLFLIFTDENYLSNDNRDQKKLRAYYKATRQAELKRYSHF